MKRALINLVAISFLFAGSCAHLEEEAEEKTIGGNELSFTASLVDVTETKTALQSDQKSIFWTPGDAINIFYGSNSAGMFSTLISEPSSTASFTGNIGVATGSANDDFVAPTFWGVYPYDPDNTCDGSSVTLKILGTQVASPGSFGIGMNPSIANSPGLGLSFYNVGSWLRFSVSQPGITSATFSGNAGEILAGNVTVTMDSNKKPFINNVTDGLTSITVTPEGGGSFVPGQLYYITLIPQTIGGTGYTLALFKDNKVATCVVADPAKTYAFNRSEYRSKKNADEGLTWDAMPERYLHFTALEDGTISLINKGGNMPNMDFSTDGTSWTSWDYSAITVHAGSKVYFKGSNNSGFSSSDAKYSKFAMTGRFAASGNIQSLLYGKDFEDNPVIPAGRCCFYCLFNNCTSLTTAPELPAIDLGNMCYESMFAGCSSLVNAPKLPAKVLTYGCYSYMFHSCSNLITAPELPATELAEQCYYFMFYGCTQLITPPVILPATTLTPLCYGYMFSGCSSLKDAPIISATILAHMCCREMFSECINLTKAPDLPAEIIDSYCYYYMFKGCFSLKTAPEILPATVLADFCYDNMFRDCASLISSPKLPATSLASCCYNYMFYNCNNLSSAPELPAKDLNTYCYRDMFYNCTSLTVAPNLPATRIAKYCYTDMFNGCSSLSAAPDLPATVLADYCYQNMFRNCARLTAAPTLPALTLVDNCYQGMFSNCTSLTTAPNLPSTLLAKRCYSSMFNGCSSLTVAPDLPATVLADYCYSSMFNNCSNLSYIKMMATEITASGCLDYWVSGVKSAGIFVKNASATWEIAGPSGIPNGWEVKTASN